MLEDSDESVDRGRGMNSRVSEKPTRARAGAGEVGTGDVCFSKELRFAGGLAGPKKLGLRVEMSAGVVGALPARCPALPSASLLRNDRS